MKNISIYGITLSLIVAVGLCCLPFPVRAKTNFDYVYMLPGEPDDYEAVWVVYGSSGGLTAEDGTHLFQGYNSIPDTSETDDRFGWSLAAGNFADVAIGVPYETYNGVLRTGITHILFGTALWLNTNSNTHHENQAPVGSAEEEDRWGRAVLLADTNGDGYDDLFIGVPGEDYGSFVFDMGSVHRLPADSSDEGVNHKCTTVIRKVRDYKADYTSFEEMEDLFNDLQIDSHGKSEDIFRLEAIGQSHEGRPIYGVKISDHPYIDDDEEIGIDLNRSFSHEFNYGAASDCNSSSYNGGEPFYVTESKVLKNFVNNHMFALAFSTHTAAQWIASPSEDWGMGFYIAEEAKDIYSVGRPYYDMRLYLVDPYKLDQNGDKVDKDGGVWQFYGWLWQESDSGTDDTSRRTIQTIFCELPFMLRYDDMETWVDEVNRATYGYESDGVAGQYEGSDNCNKFHPSSGKLVDWVIHRYVAMAKYLIKQSEWPFGPRDYLNQSRRPESPDTDLALIGAKISDVGSGLEGCFITPDNKKGRDFLYPGIRRITWNIQNNGTSLRDIIGTVNISNVTNGSFQVSNQTVNNVDPDEVATFTYDYDFENGKEYIVEVSTNESNSLKNDIRRFVFTTYGKDGGAAITAGHGKILDLVLNIKPDITEDAPLQIKNIRRVHSTTGESPYLSSQDGLLHLPCDPFPEVCNGLDDDCDRMIDEEGAQGCTVYYLDEDGDGFGIDGLIRCLCSPDTEAHYTATHGGDPDDSDPDICPEPCLFYLMLRSVGIDLGPGYIRFGNVLLGVEETAKMVPPLPPFNPTVVLKLVDMTSTPYEYYHIMINQIQAGIITWTLKVEIPKDIYDTYGEASYPLLFWDPGEIVMPCTLQLRRGKDGTIVKRPLLIPDMSATHEYQTTAEDGTNSLWYTIVYLPPRWFFHDGDGDGYGDRMMSLFATLLPEGYVGNAGDCDDTNPQINPETVWYADVDGDGYGNSLVSMTQCQPPEGYIMNAGDCNEEDKDIYPGAFEICDGWDNDCNGEVDDGLAQRTYYRDADHDGYGDPDAMIQNCAAPLGYVEDGSDCNDNEKNSNPGLIEMCDGVDNDCDNEIDEEGASDCTIYYLDADVDGYGVSEDSKCLCLPDETGHYIAMIAGDPNDADPTTPCVFSATILATGLDLGQEYTSSSEVLIGISDTASTTPASQEPAPYSVYMKIKDLLISSPITWYSEDIRQFGQEEERWLLSIDVPEAVKEAYPETWYPELSWDPGALCPGGFFSLFSANSSGDLVSILVADMRQTSSYQVQEDDVDYICVVWFRCITIGMDLPLGWSMISLPVKPINSTASVLFPGARVIYGFNKEIGYVRVANNETLEVGKGYWILLEEAKEFILTGQSINEYSFEVDEAGWEMTGGCSSPALTSIESGDGNIVVIYGFVLGLGYQRVQEEETLEPGKGYWISISGPAQVIVKGMID